MRRRKTFSTLQFTEGIARMIPFDELYSRLLEGSMEVERDPSSPPNPSQTPEGIRLVSSENPDVFMQLGEDLLLFTEWCQSFCSWRRRSYLVVLNELTRLIHKEFAEAQIELYGSSRTGLMIPSSDVDIVIVNHVNILDSIATLLSDIPWIQEVRVFHSLSS